MCRRSVAVGLLALALAAAAFAAEKTERDPTQPFGRTPGAQGATGGRPRFALTAVVISPTRRVAIVNGKPFLTGEIVDGAEIVAIEHSSVRLRENGTDVVISLGRPGNGRQSEQGEPVP